MKIGVHANPNKPEAIEVAKEVCRRLADRCTLVLSPETASATGLEATTASVDQIEADVLVVVGGDGTFLSTAPHTVIPLLPVNAGTVGFLSEVDGRNARSLDIAIDRLVRGQYFLEQRMKIGSRVDGQELPDAVNEVVVHTSQVAKMRLFEIDVDGRPVGRIRGDGLILASPTGSTSYALSALGPIVDPGIEAIVLAALAPFQATQRAVLVDPLRTVGVRLVQPGKDGVVVVDGQSETRIPGGARVEAYRSPRKVAFVRFESRYFDRLRGHRILPWHAIDDEPESSDADLPSSA
jgi:NAD+ kinase